MAARIRDSGGRAEAVEADLTDPGTPAMLFDLAQFRVDAMGAGLTISEFARRR